MKVRGGRFAVHGWSDALAALGIFPTPSAMEFTNFSRRRPMPGVRLGQTSSSSRVSSRTDHGQGRRWRMERQMVDSRRSNGDRGRPVMHRHKHQGPSVTKRNNIYPGGKHRASPSRGAPRTAMTSLSFRNAHPHQAADVFSSTKSPSSRFGTRPHALPTSSKGASAQSRCQDERQHSFNH